MNDQAPIQEAADALPDEAVLRVAALEERVRRLEEMFAALQEARPPETGDGRGSQLRESAGMIIEAGRHLLPAAVGALKEGADAAEAQERARAQTQAPAARATAAQPWLLFDVYAEARAMLRMYFDPRYRLGWQARTLPLILVAAIVTSWLWIPGTAVLPTFLSGLIVKAVDLGLAFVLYKVLHREVRRYRETSPDLPPSLRL